MGKGRRTPTTDTKQLLTALERDGYAARRVGASVLSRTSSGCHPGPSLRI